MSFLKTKSILVMALFLSLLTYGSHLPESGGMMNKKNLISEVDPGGISDFVVDSFFDDETGYPAFVLAIPRAVAVVGFDPNNQSDVTIINGTFHEYQEVDFGDDVIYHFIAVEGVSPGAIGESYDITLTVNENAFTIGGIGNQVSSQVFTVTGTTPTPVNTPPTVSLTSPSNGSEFTVGDNVAITAIASDSDGIESVSFVVGNNVEFTDTTAPYSFNWIATLLEEELSTVRVIAIDNTGEVTTSPNVNITVAEELVVVPVPGNDRAGLMAIYNATGGPNWTNNLNWGANQPIGTWYGVTANNEGRVTSLDLNSNNLVGSIPIEIGNLTSLTRLILGDNNLSGSIPESMGTLNELNVISLMRNNLSGSIPATINFGSMLYSIYQNKFNFSDLEAIPQLLETEYYNYSPQQNIDVVSSQSVEEGGVITLNNPLTSVNNSYEWFKDGVALGVSTKNLVISNATTGNAGVYHFTVTNSILTPASYGAFVLTSESITLTVNEGSVTPPPTPPLSPGEIGSLNQNMGINIDGSLDYSIDKHWADVMRSHRSWSTTGNHDNGGDAPRDANGWPSTDATCLLYAGLTTGNNHGTYKLSFETSNTSGVSVSADGGGITIRGKLISGNIVSYTMVISDPNNSDLYLNFTGTGNGVRNVKLMRPIIPGSTESYPENTEFTTQFLAMVAPFSTIRFMDWTSTNSNDDDVWEERTKWTDASQANPPVIAGKNYEWQGRGASWESVIKMSNTLGKDAWICIPHKATDGYIRELARLFRDGNEFTSGLNSDLNLYVEYSNEIWNDTGGFAQTQEVANAAIANATDPYLNFDNILGEIPNFDGTIDPNNIADDEYQFIGILTMREKAARTVRISEIFREEFGDTQMMSRIRPVLAFFKGQNNVNAPMISYIDRYFNKRDSRSPIAEAHPVNYYLWGCGGSTYWSSITEEEEDNGTGVLPTISNIWEAGEYKPEEYYKALKNDMIAARSYGLEYVSYEGNTHYTTLFDPVTYEPLGNDEAIIMEASALPQMKEEFKEHHQVFESLGGYLNGFFNTTGGSFALTLNNEDFSTPKFQAIYEMTNEAPQTVTYKNEAPFSLGGGQFDFIPSYTEPGAGSLSLISNNTNLEENGNVAGYIFSVPSTGTYQVEVSYSGSGTSGLVIEFDGNLIETIASATTGTFIQSITCSVNRLHSIRVVAVGTTLDGTVTINTVAVNTVSTQNVVSNQFQNLLIPTQVSLIKESSNLMFPNPANIGDNVSIRDIEGNTVHVEILNMGNILIREETVQVRNNTYTFNTSNLSSGIYIVKITNTEDNRTVTKRMVIGSGK